jgi:hypothetical protein
MAADMDNSGRCSLAEFSRLHLEKMKQAKPGQASDQVSTDWSDAEPVLPEHNFAYHVVSGMSKFREGQRPGFRTGSK